MSLGMSIAAAIAAFCVGLTVGLLISRAERKNRSLANVRSVTREIFVVSLWAAVIWISLSYAIAIYATVRLGQVYTLAELSKPALDALMVVVGGKVLGNVFEHNDGPIFGTSQRVNKDIDA